MGNQKETEEQMKERLKREILAEMEQEKNNHADEKDRMRKEILDELNNNSNVNISIDNNIQSFGPPKKSKVSFEAEKEKSEIEVKDQETKVREEKGSSKGLGLVVTVVLIVIIGILLFPTINKQIAKIRTSKKVDIKIEEPPKKEYEKITLKSEEIKKLKFPVMHVNNANKNTHYSDEKITISNFSNSEILYNALIDVYSGFIENYKGSYDGKYCGGSKKAVAINSRYIKLRIEDIFGKTTNYKYTNIKVPVNNNKTAYIGTWKYNKAKDKFIYYGDCTNSKKANILYYDIRIPYEASSDEKNTEIYVYDYVVFALVNNKTKSYVIYNDSNYTNEITKGVLTTNNYEKELTNIANKLGKDNLKKYKNTFTVHNCSYSDRYCFLSGEWQK